MTVVASWVRRDFDGVGVTQYEPGRHLGAVQDHYGGRVLLCIDVSYSMEGAKLAAAVDGGLDFLGEARAAHYRCGLILWDGTVEAHLSTTTPIDKVRRRLRRAAPGPGTVLAPTIKAAIKELGHLSGDRVVCVFSDGAIFDPGPTAKLAAKARELGIRFVVRGLGSGAADSLARVLEPDEEGSAQTIKDVRDVRHGIASMAFTLRRRR